MIVAILSALVAIGGIVMLILAITFVSGKNSIMEVDMGTDINAYKDLAKNSFFGILLIISLIAIGTGIGGITCVSQCTQGKCGKCMTIFYGLGIGLVFLAYIIVGAVVAGVSSQSHDEIKKFCDGHIKQTQAAEVGTQVNHIDTIMNSFSGSLMCSQVCQC